MAIELIGKIKPKNNGAFAMVDAEDVEMPDGRRLSEVDLSTGRDGEDGVSPSVTVTAITGGHRVSITDASGTKTFDVMDGEDGEDGQGASITVDSELSVASENPVQNKVVAQNFNNAMLILQNNVMPNLLPTVSAEDNGRILQVVNGAWAAVTMAQWAGGEY